MGLRQVSQRMICCQFTQKPSLAVLSLMIFLHLSQYSFVIGSKRHKFLLIFGFDLIAYQIIH